MAVGEKQGNPKMDPGKWNQRLKPAVWGPGVHFKDSLEAGGPSRGNQPLGFSVSVRDPKTPFLVGSSLPALFLIIPFEPLQPSF